VKDFEGDSLHDFEGAHAGFSLESSIVAKSKYGKNVKFTTTTVTASRVRSSR
jgi:hypothetical protein